MLLNNGDFLSSLVESLQDAFRPLKRGLESAEEFTILLGNLGWDISPGILAIAEVQNQFTEVLAAFDNVQNLVDQALEADGPTAFENSLQIIDNLQTIMTTLRNLEDISAQFTLFPLDAPAFWTEFPSDLLYYLFITYLEDNLPVVFAVCLLLGIVTEELVDVGEAPGRRNYIRRAFHWDRLADMFQPQKLFKAIYSWDTSQFQFVHFLHQLARVLQVQGFMLSLRHPEQELVNAYYDTDNAVYEQVRELYVPLTSGTDHAEDLFEMALAILPIPPAGDRAGAPVGIAIGNAIQGQLPTLQFGPLELQLAGGFQTDAGIRLEIRPEGVTVQLADTTATQVNAAVSLSDTPPEPIILLGTEHSHHLQIAGYRLGLYAEGAVDDPEFKVELSLDNMELVLDFSDSDSFVQELSGAEESRFAFGGGVTWSSKHGLTFKGHGSLEATIGIRKSLGFVSIESLTLGLGIRDGVLALTAAVSGSAQLGPVAATVDKVGMRFLVEPRGDQDPPGNFGMLDVDFDFKPPEGIGLVVDAGPIAGGGFLAYDAAHERYAGVLQLAFNNIELLAVGLLTTRLPDGSPGYSLLIMITAEFEPIQLGLGFTLNGVGGLVGLHRAADVDVLRAGLRANTLDSVLFPEDPVRNAPRIISDLRRVFPPTRDRHVFAPMALIGWGSPTVVTAKVGVVIELPDPVRLIILGQVRCQIPSEESPSIRINADILGVLDFDRGEFSLDANIYDSKLGSFDLSGEIALRSRWKDDPLFALSIGGFHPRFQPPPGFPALRRMTVSLGSDNNPRLILEGYIALTSNSIQFGARAEVFAGAGSFSVHGYVSFDALFILSPFSFVVEIAAAVDVRFSGNTLAAVYLEGTLQGPRPWRVHGKATFKIWIFSYTKSFDKRFGSDRAIELPAKDPLPELQAAIADSNNWSSPLPHDADMIVTLRKDTAGDTGVRAHPMGYLEFRQNVLPLNHPLTRFGGGALASPTRLTIASVRSNGVSEDDGQPLAATPLHDYFAPGQFETMSEDEKLTRRAFERMQSGVQVASDTLLVADHEVRDLTYETVLIDKQRPRVERHDDPITRSLGLALHAHSAARQSPLATRGVKRFATQERTRRVAVMAERYVAVDTDTLAVQSLPDIDGQGTTQAQAIRALEEHLTQHPEQRGRLQVAPSYEAVGA